MESYKKLSLDSGDQTVVLLEQISKQLAGLTNGTRSNPPASQPPSVAIVLVNVMWLMSLVLSITSALFAMMLQQWARRYIQTAQVPTLASQRARVRSFLFLGLIQYDMSLTVEAASALLHSSVFLFFAGLVIFFCTIHKTAAVAVSINVGLVAVIYVALTLLPLFDKKCPYRTPMSNLCWHMWHTFFSLTARCSCWVSARIHECLVSYNLGQNMACIQTKLISWRKIYEDAYEEHRCCLKEGFQRTVIRTALNAPVDVDRVALTRFFSELTLDRSEFLTFMASIPRHEIVRIMTPPFESRGIVFREHLLTLIKSCTVGTNVRGLDEEKRKSCLLVWSAAVLHIIKEFFIPNRVPPLEPDLLDDVLINFANIDHMQAMWAHSDTAIRLVSRSICALLAKCLLQNGHINSKRIRWLVAVTNVRRAEIIDLWVYPGAFDHVILTSFVCGIFPHYGGDAPKQVGNFPVQEGNIADLETDVNLRKQAGDTQHDESDLPIAYASFIKQTLSIIMGVGTEPHFNRLLFTAKLSNLIHQMEGGDPHASFVANELRRMFPEFIQATSYLPTPALAGLIPGPTSAHAVEPECAPAVAPAPALEPAPTLTSTPAPKHEP